MVRDADRRRGDNLEGAARVASREGWKAANPLRELEAHGEFEGCGVALSAKAAEFFAGIGLVRAGLERVGVDVVWANDIETVKHAVYASNFDSAHYVLGDIRGVQGCSVPGVDIATASFPCVDLS